MPGLLHVIWIGGGTGAGKTSIATALAERHALQTYHYDYHDARDHSERIDPARHPLMHAWEAMSLDERWVLTSPAEMARLAIDAARERLEMVIADLLARPLEVPIVAEGFGFYPNLIAPLLPDAHHGIWLLPTRRFRETALAARGWSPPQGIRDPARARTNKLERDALVDEYTRSTASKRGLTVVEVRGDRTLDEVLAEVESHVAPALAHYDQSRRRADIAHDEELRQAILASFRPFLAACTRGHSVVERVAARYRLEAYRLGLLNSAYLAAGGAAVTEEELRRAVPTATHSRVGPEHWLPLVDASFAGQENLAWVLTDRGIAVLRDLYAEVRAEVARRSVRPALVGRVGEILERGSYRVPLSTRARFIRELWGEDGGTTLTRLYRAVWELSVLPDVSGHEHLWPNGVLLDALKQDFTDILRAVEA